MIMPSVSNLNKFEKRSLASRRRHKKGREKYLKPVKNMFDAGYPVNRIANEIGRGRGVVNSCLSDLGIELPSISEGNIRSAALASPDERLKRVASAHAAIRSMGGAESTRILQSLNNSKSERYIGVGEREVNIARFDH